MWKRWSFRALPSAASDGDKVNPQLPPTDNTEAAAAAADPAERPEPVTEDEPVDSVTKGVTESPSALEASIHQTDEVQDTPANHEAAVPVPPDDTINNDIGPSTELPDSLPTKNSPPPHTSPLPEAAPENEGASSALTADKSDSASVSPPVEDKADDTDSKVQGNEDVPTPANTLLAPQSQHPLARARRLSFRSLAFFYGRDKEPVAASPPPTSPSSPTLKAKPAAPVKSKPKSPPKPKLSRSERHALSSALALRTLIIGPGAVQPESSAQSTKHAKLTSAQPPPDLKKLKGQLLKPKSANAVIAQLRRLPLPDGPSFHPAGRASAESLITHPDAGGAPIHAVCLACTDVEADEKHFSRLRASHNQTSASPSSPDALSAAAIASSSQGLLSVGTASLESLIPVLQNLRLVSLLASPDLGFGQPVSDDENSGPLTGAVPSAGAVADGLEEITKQLMALGFATSKAVFPSHAGIYPPEDRMSVLTYWWGLELILPEPSVKFLSKVKSISNTLLNFLSALALFNNGVREVLPFIRYVANFVSFEWSAIKAQDKGRGVVCAATWVMPAAMVPRPWDFPTRPASTPDPTAPATTPTPAPKTAPVPDKTNGDVARSGETPAQPPPQESYPATPPNVMYPPAPAMPMLPQLMVTPATLPRGANPPQQETPA